MRILCVASAFMLLAVGCSRDGSPIEAITIPPEESAPADVEMIPTTTVVETTTTAMVVPMTFQRIDADDLSDVDWILLEELMDTRDREEIQARMEATCDRIETETSTFDELQSMILDEGGADALDMFEAVNLSVRKRCPNSPAAVEWLSQ